MLKNKAMYVRVVDTRTMQPADEEPPREPGTSVEEIINNVVYQSGNQIVKSVITVMVAYFGLSTLSKMIVNNTDPRRK